MANKFRFDLSNKIVYLFCSFILIFILTYINNQYFYEHVERTSSRQAIQLEKLLIDYINKNNQKDKVLLEKDILNFMETWSDYSYYNNGITVIDFNNKEHIIKEKKKWDKAAYTYLNIDLNKLLNKNSDAFILNSKVNKNEVFKSIFRSMTFSIIDIYEDIKKETKSKYNGQIILIKDAKEKLYDGIININGKEFEDIKGAKILEIINQNTSQKETVYITAYNELKVQEGMYVKEGQVLATGTIYTALNNFQNIYWYRSRPFIFFTIFTFLILFLFNRRIKLLQKIEEELKKINIRIEEEKEEELRKKDESNKKALEELEEQINIAIEEKENLLKKQHKLENEYKLVCTQFKQYDSFVKFAFRETSIDELLEKNRVILGNMFRLIAEKIVYSLFEKNVRSIDKYNDNLDSCLKEIRTLQILSKESINALFAVKNFGNENSHYTGDDREISLSKTIVIAKELVDVIEEYFSLDLKLEDKNTELKIEITKSEKVN